MDHSSTDATTIVALGIGGALPRPPLVALAVRFALATPLEAQSGLEVG